MREVCEVSVQRGGGKVGHIGCEDSFAAEIAAIIISTQRRWPFAAAAAAAARVPASSSSSVVTAAAAAAAAAVLNFDVYVVSRPSQPSPCGSISSSSSSSISISSSSSGDILAILSKKFRLFVGKYAEIILQISVRQIGVFSGDIVKHRDGVSQCELDDAVEIESHVRRAYEGIIHVFTG